MAVNPVDNNQPTSSTTSSSGEENRLYVPKETLAQKTAAEIVEGYDKWMWQVPADILDWARKSVEADPESKITYGEALESGQVGEGSDAIDYQKMLEEEGMSLKEQCKVLTEISEGKEVRDLNNVTRMSPFAGDIMEGEQEGDGNESAVKQFYGELVKQANEDGKKPMFLRSERNAYNEDMRFFDALKGTSEENVEGIDESLEEISDVLSESLDNAKESKDYGEVTVATGLALKGKHNSKVAKIMGISALGGGIGIALGGLISGLSSLFSSKRKVANKAIQQGNNTINMSEKTTQLATALAKDNNIALESLENNEANINNTGDDTSGGEPTAGGESGGTTSGATSAGGASSSAGGGSVSAA